MAQGDAGPESGGRNSCGRQKFSFVRQKSLSPATVFSTSRNRFFGYSRACERTQTANASSNGGDASRVGERGSCYLVELVFFSFNIPTRDASSPLEVAFGAWVRSRIHVLPGSNIKRISCRTTVVHQRASVMTTVTSRAPWAPNTRACSMSAVLEGPEMKQPKGAAVGSGNWW